MSFIRGICSMSFALIGMMFSYVAMFFALVATGFTYLGIEMGDE